MFKKKVQMKATVIVIIQVHFLAALLSSVVTTQTSRNTSNVSTSTSCNSSAASMSTNTFCNTSASSTNTPCNTSVINDMNEIQKMLDDMANKDETIYVKRRAIFKPSINGFLGQGSFGVTYKGYLLDPIEREVAMKFTRSSDEFKAAMEYEIYTYLGAINNTNVERYGIPAVYYYGTWNDYVLMAITLLDSKFSPNIGSFRLSNRIDVLILFREFVRISKYIHNHGVRHNDIKFDNMMFRKHQGFIIDYNMATKMYKRSGFVDAVPDERPETIRKYAKEDWERFLYSICEFMGVKFDCVTIGSLNEIINEDIPATMEKIEEIKYKGLRRVFVEFAKHVFYEKIEGSHLQIFDNSTIPFYDQMYHVICEAIEKYKIRTPVLVSWLTDKDVEKAEEELENDPIPDIASVTDCFEGVDHTYPVVDFNYFSVKKTKTLRLKFDVNKLNEKIIEFGSKSL